MTEATQDTGAILERLESYLGAEEAPPAEETTTAETEAEAEEDAQPVEDETEELAEESESDDSDEVESTDAIDQEGEALELSDLAEYLKIEADKLDVDDDGNLFVKTKIDGEEGRATLADLIKSYQLEGHLNKQNMEVQALKKELEAKRAETEQQAQERITHLESLMNLALGELVKDYQAIDWQDLRVTDPAEYAAKQADFSQRQAQINGALQKIEMEKQHQGTLDQGRQQEILQEESRKLLNAIPEWKDASLAERERSDLRKFALGAGYSEQEIANLYDHRQVLLLRDAMRYRQLQESKPSVTNRVKKAPKLTKPGAPKAQKELAKQKTDLLRKKIKNSGGKDGVIEYLLSTGKV